MLGNHRSLIRITLCESDDWKCLNFTFVLFGYFLVTCSFVSVDRLLVLSGAINGAFGHSLRQCHKLYIIVTDHSFVLIPQE